MDTMLALILWMVPMSDSMTVTLHEKYGAPITYTNANAVTDYEGSYYVWCRGNLAGTFPKANYSVERK
jgi:hypothetical protein